MRNFKNRTAVCWVASLSLMALDTLAQTRRYTLSDSEVEIAVDAQGNLASLKNVRTGQEYAAGLPLWRLYFDRKEGQKENEVLAKDNAPEIRQETGRIELRYGSLKASGVALHMRLALTVWIEDGLVRFGSEVSNDEPHTIIRELHYPLVGGCRLEAGDKLLTTFAGGQLFSDPLKRIVAVGNNPPYMAPSQYYRQMDLKYPSHTWANCFAFVGEKQGLYFGSHDPTFQDTWHGLRVYPDATGAFTVLEAGLYKYPNCTAGQTWTCGANVIAPYSGNWHQTSKIYRKWADTWWHPREVPRWVRLMKGWQRVIFTHQYGEKLFSFSDLNGRMRRAGESVGVESVLAFAWWQSGMDNGYPDCYWVTDPAQGGDVGWASAISDFRKNGGRLLLYFNGKLIDEESDFYRKGEGKKVCYHDNVGAEYTEQYRFKGMGTFTGQYNARTFVVANTRNPVWRKRLLDMADRAIAFGADSVFYDQLGYCEPSTDWDVSGEFPIPNTRIMADKADTLKAIHDHMDAKGNKDFALGTECYTDVTAQQVDYIHNITGATAPGSFAEWGRYTFPEVVISDREIRDDTDIPHRVNHAMLKGLRSDIEIYRCRDLIDKTPNYQRHLAKVNRLKDKYAELLLLGLYRDTDGIVNGNAKVEARSFVNGNRLAIVVTQSSEKTATTLIRVPGYAFQESDSVGEVKVDAAAKDGQTVTVGRDGLAVLVYQKEK
jgi:hypothetical protein